MEVEYLPNPLITCMPIFIQNNTKCTYFHRKMYLRGQKMYLVNNVLENQIRAVPLLQLTNSYATQQLTCICVLKNKYKCVL